MVVLRLYKLLYSFLEELLVNKRIDIRSKRFKKTKFSRFSNSLSEVKITFVDFARDQSRFSKT